MIEGIDSDNYKISLGEIVQRQLESIGLRRDNIEISSDCTFCDSEKYFSYRRDKTSPVDVMVAWMALR